MVFRRNSNDLDAPEFTFHPHSVRLNSSKDSSHNETLQLTCNATGNPVPMVEWSKLSLSDPSAGFTENFSNKWNFVIERAVTDDSGNYRCRAWNYLGQEYSNIARVIVQGKIIDQITPLLPLLLFQP